MKLSREYWKPHSAISRRRTCAYAPPNQIEIEELKRWARQLGLLTKDAVVFGITHDGPSTTPPALCRYDAAIVTDVALPELSAVDARTYQSTRLAGRAYAIATLQHTADGLANGWAAAFPALAHNGLTLDLPRAIVERYAAASRARDECELCLPIVEN